MKKLQICCRMLGQLVTTVVGGLDLGGRSVHAAKQHVGQRFLASTATEVGDLANIFILIECHRKSSTYFLPHFNCATLIEHLVTHPFCGR